MIDVGTNQAVIVTIRTLIEWISLAIEVLAVGVIVGVILAAASPRGLLRTHRDARRSDALSVYKQKIGRGLLLGLELLLAADIVSTIALDSTLASLGALGLLAVIRTFLSWSLEVELEGRWPWRAKTEARSTAYESTSAREAGD